MNTPPQKFSVTQTWLNSSPFIEKNITAVILIKNQSTCPIYGLTVTDYADTYNANGKYSPSAESAVMYSKGVKLLATARYNKNKITLEGIDIPPREKVFIFYRLHKLTD